MVNARDKGKRGERDAAAALNKLLGTSARRAQQYAGHVADATDLVGIPGLSIEVKWRQQLNLYTAMEQARVGDGVPIVIHKKDRCDWLCTVRLEDLVRFAQTILEVHNAEEVRQLGSPVPERPEGEGHAPGLQGEHDCQR